MGPLLKNWCLLWALSLPCWKCCALVFNPNSGLVSPQFHVVFDDEFPTVDYMERGEVPPHWPELFNQSRELSTDEQFQLTMDWLIDGVETSDVKEANSDTSLDNLKHTSPDVSARPTITSPFDILSDQPDVVPENDVTNASLLSRAGPSAATVRENHKRSQSSLLPSTRDRPEARSKRVRTDAGRTAKQFTSVDERGSQPTKSGDYDCQGHSQLTLPAKINLSQAGLRRSSRLKELRKTDEKNEASVSLATTTSKRKAHAPFGSSSLKKAITLFALLSNVQDSSILSHSLPPNPTTMQRLQYRIEEVHELVDGTLNCFDHFALSTTAGTNEVFTYHQARKQPDWHLFFEAMEKEINDHEEREHWTMVERSSLPSATKTIKVIWTFKRKRFPDGRINKHKARLCAHGGMQQWERITGKHTLPS